MYPATLLGIGLVGNYYIVDGQVREVKYDLKQLSRKVDGVVKGMADLVLRRDQQDLADMSLAAEIFKDCAEKR